MAWDRDKWDAKLKYEKEQRNKTGDRDFTCQSDDPEFLLWYAAMSESHESSSDFSDDSSSDSGD
jgi:hypothetical protein